MKVGMSKPWSCDRNPIFFLGNYDITIFFATSLDNLYDLASYFVCGSLSLYI